MKTLGLYIHIPFCNGKCPYCDFYSVKTNDDKFQEYTDKLCGILVEKSKSIDETIETIYFGGGTPSLIGTDRLVQILGTINENYYVEKNAEVTLEVNPTSNDLVDFNKLKEYGFNRVSVGIQSANENELKILGRKHNNDDVKITIDKIMSAGINNISVDIMLGIPEQTIDSLDSTIDFCTSLGITHISAYILKVEERTLFYKNKDKYIFPDEDITSELYLYFCKKVEEKGFLQYEISNFAKDNLYSRHNMRYWECKEYLGFGPAAHSFYKGERHYYNRSFDDFYKGKAIYDGIGGNEEEYIMLSLRLTKGMSVNEYINKFNKTPNDEFFSNIEKFKKLGYALFDGDKLCLTKKGFLISNYIISSLI